MSPSVPIAEWNHEPRDLLDLRDNLQRLRNDTRVEELEKWRKLTDVQLDVLSARVDGIEHKFVSDVEEEARKPRTMTEAVMEEEARHKPNPGSTLAAHGIPNCCCDSCCFGRRKLYEAIQQHDGLDTEARAALDAAVAVYKILQKAHAGIRMEATAEGYILTVHSGDGVPYWDNLMNAVRAYVAAQEESQEFTGPTVTFPPDAKPSGGGSRVTGYDPSTKVVKAVDPNGC
jgi:hypothetical protein